METNKNNSLNVRQEALDLRQKLLKQMPKGFGKSHVLRREYMEKLLELQVQLTNWQFEASIGLMLSDASVDLSADGRRARFKMQQSLGHLEFLKHVKELYLEYTSSDNPVAPIASRSGMYEFQTMKMNAFYELACIFHPELRETGKLGTKSITPSLKKYITPVSIAYWFCGDGGKSDFTKNQGKGITFHTQCFKKEECDILSETLREKFGFDAITKLDNPVKNQYRVDILGPSFDKFIKIIGPYIHESMTYKLPTPRRSVKFGPATKEFCKKYLSIAFKVDQYVESYQRIEID
jgi:hypothetical protein